jgi:hypothetical protein
MLIIDKFIDIENIIMRFYSHREVLGAILGRNNVTDTQLISIKNLREVLNEDLKVVGKSCLLLKLDEGLNEERCFYTIRDFYSK